MSNQLLCNFSTYCAVITYCTLCSFLRRAFVTFEREKFVPYLFQFSQFPPATNYCLTKTVNNLLRISNLVSIFGISRDGRQRQLIVERETQKLEIINLLTSIRSLEIENWDWEVS